MYTYTAGATRLDAAMPTWVQAGGLEQWIERLKDPAIRARVAAEMKQPGSDWENLYFGAGADKMILSGFKNDALQPLTGKPLAEVAKRRGTAPAEPATAPVAQDGPGTRTAPFLVRDA